MLEWYGMEYLWTIVGNVHIVKYNPATDPFIWDVHRSTIDSRRSCSTQGVEMGLERRAFIVASRLKLEWIYVPSKENCEGHSVSKRNDAV